MQVIGLTGNMGSGKSTAAKIFQAFGATVLSADQMAREVVQPGKPAYLEMRDYFGTGIISPDGTIHRKKLADIVFHDKSALDRLNTITHFHIDLLRNTQFQKIYENNPDTMLVYDVPLLFENKMQKMFQKTVLITVRPSIQMERLITYRHFSREEVTARLKNQMDPEKKITLSDFVVDNDGTIQELTQALQTVFRKLQHLPQKKPDFLPLKK